MRSGRNSLRLGRLCPTARRDVRRNPGSEHLPRIQRLSDDIAPCEVASRPAVGQEATVHMLVGDCELQRLRGDIDLGAAIKLYRERVQVAQPLDRRFLSDPGVTKISLHILVEPFQIERKVAWHHQ